MCGYQMLKKFEDMFNRRTDRDRRLATAQSASHIASRDNNRSYADEFARLIASL